MSLSPVKNHPVTKKFIHRLVIKKCCLIAALVSRITISRQTNTLILAAALRHTIGYTVLRSAVEGGVVFALGIALSMQRVTMPRISDGWLNRKH